MRFRLVEEYDGWEQEDIDLYESIEDWGDSDYYDAGFAYLDSAVLDTEEGPQRVETEFHKYFKKNPNERPIYKPFNSRPFGDTDDYIGPVSKGDFHRNYEVYNKYDKKHL